MLLKLFISLFQVAFDRLTLTWIQRHQTKDLGNWSLLLFQSGEGIRQGALDSPDDVLRSPPSLGMDQCLGQESCGQKHD